MLDAPDERSPMGDADRVLVTGANGFVGRHLCSTLRSAGHTVRAAVRRASAAPAAAEPAVIGDIGPSTAWRAALEGVDTVIHLAGRAHVLHDPASAAHLYEQTNALGTERLAAAAAECGVRRFVFLSSIKVNGEETSGRGYAAADRPDPKDAYGVSKWRAERHVWRVAATSRLEGVVVRPPLVYGPGVRANFLRLMRWVERGWPLPLGSIHNARSLVSVWNLCDLLANVVRNPRAPGGTWLVSDGQDLSTTELVRRLGAAMHRPVTLLPIPAGVLAAGAALLGRRAEAARLCGSLVVDIAATVADLGWTPPVPVDECLGRTAAWYLAEARAPATAVE